MVLAQPQGGLKPLKTLEGKASEDDRTSVRTAAQANRPEAVCHNQPLSGTPSLFSALNILPRDGSALDK